MESLADGSVNMGDEIVDTSTVFINSIDIKATNKMDY